MAPNGSNEAERLPTRDLKGVRGLALERGDLIDITPVSKAEGTRCPVAISRQLWTQHGNTPEIDLKSANVAYWLAKAMAQVTDGRRKFSSTKTPFGEVWHFKLEYLPEDSTDWVTIAVKSVIGPDDDGYPAITVLLSTEESTRWELGVQPEAYPMLREEISVVSTDEGLTIRFHASGIERGDLSHFLGTFGGQLFGNRDQTAALFGRLRYEFEGYDERLRPTRRGLPPLRDFLRQWHGLWPYWFLFSDFESDIPVRMFRQAFPGLPMLAGNKTVPGDTPPAIAEAEHVIWLECRTMTGAMVKAGCMRTQVVRRGQTIVRLLDIPKWVLLRYPDAF